jgi:putative hemolysin
VAFGELILILTLIVTHGLFAGSEIAIVALRRSRLKQLVDEGKESAKAVETLQLQPERFIATVQIGLTVVSATAAARRRPPGQRSVQPLIEKVAPLAPLPEGPALSSVVAMVSGAMLIVGSWFASLALRRADPMRWRSVARCWPSPM